MLKYVDSTIQKTSNTKMTKTIQPNHYLLSQMCLKLGKNEVTFRISGNYNKDYIVTSRIFLYDNKHPHKVYPN